MNKCHELISKETQFYKIGTMATQENYVNEKKLSNLK